jgi:hypothetical protein
MRATLRSLQTHVGRHVPRLGRGLVNAATLVGRDGNHRRCVRSMEGIDAQTWEPSS